MTLQTRDKKKILKIRNTQTPHDGTTMKVHYNPRRDAHEQGKTRNNWNNHVPLPPQKVLHTDS